MGNRRRRKLLTGNISPATQEETDRFKMYVPARKPKTDQDSESDIFTEDEQAFDLMKAKVSITEKTPMCEQGSCNQKADCFLIIEDEEGDEPEILGACEMHATRKKSFQCRRIYEILSLKEGLYRTRGSESPSAQAYRMFDEEAESPPPQPEERLANWHIPKQRVISEEAQKAITAARNRKRQLTKLRPSKRPQPVLHVQDYTKEFPKLPTRQAPAGKGSAKASGSKTKDKRTVPVVTVEDTSPPEVTVNRAGAGGQMPEENIPRRVDVDLTTIPSSQESTPLATEGDPPSPPSPDEVAMQTENQTGNETVVNQGQVEMQTEGQTGNRAVRNPQEDTGAMEVQYENPGQPPMSKELYAATMEELRNGPPDLPTQAELDQVIVEVKELAKVTSMGDSQELQERMEFLVRYSYLITDVDTIKEMARISGIEIQDPNDATNPEPESGMLVEPIRQPELGTRPEPGLKAKRPKISYAKAVEQRAIKGKGKEKENDMETDIPAGSETEEDSDDPITATECAMNRPDGKTRTPPYSDQLHTLWWDLSTVYTDHATIERAIVKEEIFGYSFRRNGQWLEIGYKSIELRDKALNTMVRINDQNILTPIPPRHFAGNTIFVQLANVIIWDEEEIRNKITAALSTFGQVERVEPVKYRKNGLLTRRWNAKLVIPPGTKLAMPPIFIISGIRVLAFWDGCPASCTSCLTEGHWQSQCTPAFRKKALEKVLKKTPIAPIQKAPTPQPPLQPQVTPPIQPSPATSPKNLPPPPPPPLGNKRPAGKRPVTTGKSPAVLDKLFRQQVRSEGEKRGYEVPSSSSSSSEEFTEVVAGSTVKRMKQEIARLKKKAEEAEKALKNKRKTPPKATPPNAKRSKPTEYKPKRQKVSLGQYCYYAIQYQGHSTARVEKIWNKTTEEWFRFRDALPQAEYSKIYDWARHPQGQKVNFNPSDFGMKTVQRQPEDTVQEENWEEPEAVETGPSNINLFVTIINPVTKEDERAKFTLPAGATVPHLRKEIADRYSVDPTTFSIWNRDTKLKKEIIGKELRNNFRLKVVGNWDNAKDVPPQTFATIFVVDSQNNKQTFSIDPSTTTQELVKLYAKRVNKIARQLTFLHKDIILEPYQVLSQAGVKDKSTIDVSACLKFNIRTKAVINGELQVKPIQALSESTVFDLKDDIGQAFSIAADSFELEKDGKTLSEVNLIMEDLRDNDQVHVRFRGTSKWDANRMIDRVIPEMEPVFEGRFVTISFIEGDPPKMMSESFDYKWKPEETFGDIKTYLRGHMADKELEIRFNGQQYDDNFLLKEVVDTNENELEVELVQNFEVDMEEAIQGDVSSSEKLSDSEDI